jgi:2-oxoisovalerate dehydrogenase E2 component (dihydrolipoyl transacylase)
MEFRLPELGEGVYEAELVAWHVQPRDVVHHGQSLAEVLTDKASMDVPAPFAGAIDSLMVEPGSVVKVGEVVLTYAPGSEPTKTREEVPAAGSGESPALPPPAAPAGPASATIAAPAAIRPSPAPASSGGNGPLRSVRAAPSVRRMARALGVDLARVSGTGRSGRILIDDLGRYVQARQTAAVPAAPDSPGLDVGVAGTRIKIQGLRRAVAEHMVRAKHTIPHYSYIDECDVSELVRLREAIKPSYAQKGIKLTYLAFAVKAVVAALREVPLVNASLDEATQEIVLHDAYHIGIATATPRGLIVPVIRHADRLDLGEIAAEVERLSAAARDGTVHREELLGGTFTVTSIGNLGGLISTPVINHPEAAILGLGRIVKRPIYDAQGQIRPADLLYLSFSFDHRILDGAIGALFGNAVIRGLENPAALLVK